MTSNGTAAVATNEKTIQIPAPQLRSMTVGLIGKTPLITHRFSEEALRSIERDQTKAAKTAKEARDPEAECRRALYLIDRDAERYGFPAGGLRKALVAGGGRFGDEKMTILRGVLSIDADLLEIEGSGGPQMRSDRVRIGMGKTTIAYRPMFWPWRMEVPVTFNAAMISEAQVLNLFQIAGFAIGIGDWRPECNGTFGRFTLRGLE